MAIRWFGQRLLAARVVQITIGAQWTLQREGLSYTGLRYLMVWGVENSPSTAPGPDNISSVLMLGTNGQILA